MQAGVRAGAEVGVLHEKQQALQLVLLHESHNAMK